MSSHQRLAIELSFMNASILRNSELPNHPHKRIMTLPILPVEVHQS